jgi:biopolymer transport protein ExbD
MKAITATALFVCSFQSISSAQSETRVTTKAEEALVYLNGAQLTSRGKANLKDGRQTVVFEMLSNQIDPNSVQVKADAAVTILSVNYALNYLKPQDFKEFKLLEDSVKYYTDQNARLGITRKGYEEEIAMLSANRSIGGANTGVSSTELAKLTDFVRTRMQESSLKKYEIEQKEKRNYERISALSNQLNYCSTERCCSRNRQFRAQLLCYKLRLDAIIRHSCKGCKQQSRYCSESKHRPKHRTRLEKH